MHLFRYQSILVTSYLYPQEHSGRLYKAAHLFFTEIIPDEMLVDIAKSDIAPFVQTGKWDLHIQILPI